MSGKEIQPVSQQDFAVQTRQTDASVAAWGGREQPPEKVGPKLQRAGSALNRFKWLIVLCAALGFGVGYSATRVIKPEYEVQARVLLEQGTGARGAREGGPIMAEELLERTGWGELLTSYIVADPVVTDLALFVRPLAVRDSALFKQFDVGSSLKPGEYTLRVDGNSWTLSVAPGVLVERGAVGDSVGRAVGFRWQPTTLALAAGRDIRFNVQTPREASNDLIKRLQKVSSNQSSFLVLRLTGRNAAATARTLNAWVAQFVSVATQLKKRTVMLSAEILEGQRSYAAAELDAAESALERYRVQTITQPNERQSVMPGIELTTNPALAQYFSAKDTADRIQRDREALQRVLSEGKEAGVVTREAVLSIPSINTDPAAEQVRRLLAEQSDKEVALRQLRVKYTDDYRDVKIAAEQLEQHRSALVPRALERYLNQLELREKQLVADIDRGGRDLRGIPVRAIEEQRLKRKVEVADVMYRSLDVEAARAKLAEAQAVPDIEVLDTAVAPLRPTQNTAPVLVLAGVGAGLLTGVLLALLLDRIDKRFRYPEQASVDLGLFVLGVVPVIKRSRRTSTLGATQVIESFRTIRMNVRYAADPTRPMAFTITSPGPNDGKSLIAANLALSFAESGARTLLIDGDIRRGELSKDFQTPSKPGLVEYLDGTALVAEVLQPVAAHANLTLMPGGARRQRGPELLATARLSQLINQMCHEFDVVVVDSPPLGAGFDAFALSTATTNMILVLRNGVSDRKMAEAKLAVVDTLPIRVMGTVLNGIEMSGQYEYYSYYQDYAAVDEDPVTVSEPAPRSIQATSSAGKS